MGNQSLILVVDDEADIREILGMQIQDLGFEFVEAENGQQALELIENSSVDVVISDISMPKMNGIDFLRNCRLNGFDKPFIVLTGNATKSTALEALRLGAFDFLEKPFNPTQMKSLFIEAMKTSKDSMDRQINTQIRDTLDANQERLRLPADELNNTNSWEFGESELDFIESFFNQLSFCRASVKGLLKKNQIPIELGYLFRVMRSLSLAAKNWEFYDLSSLAFEMTEALLYFRAHPEELTSSHIQTLSVGLNSLSNIFDGYKKKDSVLTHAKQTRSTLRSLNKHIVSQKKI